MSEQRKRESVKFPKLKWILLTPVILFAGVYIVGAVMLALDEEVVAGLTGDAATYQEITIFGASGTAGDGILKAALADPDIETIQVITRRATPRIEEGVAKGKVQMTLHMGLHRLHGGSRADCGFRCGVLGDRDEFRWRR